MKTSKMTRGYVFGILMGLLLISTVHGELMVQVGGHELLPNTADQTIPITVTGGDPIAGVILRIQVGDGSTGPVITNVDLETGTVFEGLPVFALPPEVLVGEAESQIVILDLTDTIFDVPADGLLATVTVSTEGIESGEFNIAFTTTTFGTTEFAEVGRDDPVPGVGFDDTGVVTIPAAGNGNIPEPAALVLWGLGLSLVGLQRGTRAGSSHIRKCLT